MLPAVGWMRDLGADPAPLALEGLEETPDANGGWARLTPAQIAVLDRFGERRRVATGEPVSMNGEPITDFVVVVSGVVALVDGYGRDDRVRSVQGEGRFLGGLGVLTGEAMLLTPVAQRPADEAPVVITRDGEVLRNPSEDELTAALGLERPGD